MVVLESEAAVIGMVRSSEGVPWREQASGSSPPSLSPEAPGTHPMRSATRQAGSRSAGSGRTGSSSPRSGPGTRQRSFGATAPTEEVVFVLSPRGRITGRVVDPYFCPVADVALQAVSVKTETFGGMAIQGGAVVETRSHEDGTFAIDGSRPAPSSSPARGREWQESSPAAPAAGRPGSRRGRAGPVHKAALLEGQVVEPDGSPVARAEISRDLPPRPGEIRYEAPLALQRRRRAVPDRRPGARAPRARRPARDVRGGGPGNRRSARRQYPRLRACRRTDGLRASGRSSGYPVAEARGLSPVELLGRGVGRCRQRARRKLRFEGISPGSYRLEAQKKARAGLGSRCRSRSPRRRWKGSSCSWRLPAPSIAGFSA